MAHCSGGQLTRAYARPSIGGQDGQSYELWTVGDVDTHTAAHSAPYTSDQRPPARTVVPAGTQQSTGSQNNRFRCLLVFSAQTVYLLLSGAINPICICIIVLRAHIEQ